ncbi:hypothetical protein WJX77_011842 [Trebouxia sp. C0004]
MAKHVVAAGIFLLVAQSCFETVHGYGTKTAHKRSLLANALDYDEEYESTASAPSSSPPPATILSPPPPPPVIVTEITVSNSSSNTTVSKNALVPAVVSTIHFTGFANVQAFDTKAQANFVSAIESPLKAAGYNVRVINVVATPGSIFVTSTTEFLDGSTTGASDFAAALGDTTSVAQLFPSSVYGVVIVKSVKSESVSTTSGAVHYGISRIIAACLTLLMGAMTF